MRGNAAVLVVCGVCAGCVSQSSPPAPPVLPANFEHVEAGAVEAGAVQTGAVQTGAAQTGAAHSGAAHSGPSSGAPSFYGFGSPELVRLLALADRNSFDLEAAVARVRQADARVRQAGGALLPEIGAGADATRYTGTSHGATAHETDWSTVLNASFEVDFWGRNRAVRDSARALAQSSREELQTVKITVASSVIETYFEVQSLRERIALAKLNVDVARTVASVAEARYRAGVTTPIDLAQQRAAVANAGLGLLELQQHESAARAALALLLGRMPEGFDVETHALDSFEEPPIDAGLPSQLLQRRPDLRAAESNLRAAHGDVLAARAAMFPSLSLTAQGGVQNPAVQAAVITLAGTGLSLTAGADLVQTIFDNGRRRSVIDAAAAREQELLAEYRGAVLSALEDTENALGELHTLDDERDAQQENVAQTTRALAGSQLRYREGAAQYLTLLEAQRGWYAAREQFSLYRLARLQAKVSLGKALGGDWQTQ